MTITRKGFGLGLLAACGLTGISCPGEVRAQGLTTAKLMGDRYDWTTIPYGAGGYVTGFFYHPTEKGLLYSRTDVGGAYRFDPVNKRWIPLLDHLGRAECDYMGVLSIALDPNNANRVYMACGEYLGTWAPDGAILRSDDRGATWQTTKLKIKVGGNAEGRGCGERLQVDPNLGDILFYGSNQDGLWKSTDRGVSFNAVGFPTKKLSLVLFDPKSGQPGQATQTLYIGSGEGKGGLYVSNDAGGSFKPVEGTPELIPQRAAFDGEGNLYVSFGDGLTPLGGKTGAIMRRDAKTGKWKDITPQKPGAGGAPDFSYCGLDVDPNRPGTVVVSTSNRWATGDDIYLSRDGGSRWTMMGPKARHDPGKYAWLKSFMGGRDRMGHWIADVKIDPFDADSMVYGTGYGLWMTHNLSALDTGQTVKFDFEVSNFEEIATTALASPPSGAVLLAAFSDLAGAAYDVTDATPQTGLFEPVAVSNRSVDFAEKSPAFVVRTADDRGKGGYISIDGALTWKTLPNTPRVPVDAQGNYQNGGRLAISADASALAWGLGRQGVFWSGDLGVTWTKATGLPDRPDLYPFAERAFDKTFYVFDREGQTLYISVDSGASYKALFPGLPKIAGWQSAQFISTPQEPRDLWLASSIGLFHAKGVKQVLRQVPFVDEAWLVSVGKAAEGKAYPAVYIWGKVRGVEGLFRSDDEGTSWARINDNQRQYGSLRAMAADPLEYGTLYIAPHGRGLVAGRIRS